MRKQHRLDDFSARGLLRIAKIRQKHPVKWQVPHVAALGRDCGERDDAVSPVAAAAGGPARTARPGGVTVDAVQLRQGRAHAADRMANALKTDMAYWLKPSVEGFYGRLPKAALAKAVIEAKVTAAAPFDSVKKLEAAQMAAKALQGSGWRLAAGAVAGSLRHVSP